jgi:hypothetical protein
MGRQLRRWPLGTILERPARGSLRGHSSRRWCRENGPQWGEAFAGALKMAEGDTDKALALMGVKIAGQLRDAIEAANVAANSPVTDLLFQRFPKGGQTFADVQQARADVAVGETAPAKSRWYGLATCSTALISR